MNVLAVLPLYVPRSRVGAWVTTHEYLAGMAARGHTVTVVTLYSTRPAYTIDGVRVVPNGSDVPAPDTLISHLGDEGAGAHLAVTLGVPSIRFVHGFHDDNARRLDAHPTTLAIFASHALAADTAWDGPALVAHPPIHPDQFTVTPGDHVTLINLSAPKGGKHLGWIAQAHPSLPFLGVRGWGEQFKPNGRNIEVIDPVEDIRTVYARTRILLVLSEAESYGRCAVEAACSGIPTIAHPSPGLIEAMGDAATWIHRRNRRAWIAEVGRLQDGRSWAAASRRARKAIPTDAAETITTVCDAIEAA